MESAIPLRVGDPAITVFGGRISMHAAVSTALLISHEVMVGGGRERHRSVRAGEERWVVSVGPDLHAQGHEAARSVLNAVR
jgi:hypothetical protein